jgi:prefoldin subunit 5
MPQTPPFDPWGVSQLTKDQELQLLKSQADALRAQLEQIQQRINQIESGS